MLVVALPDSFFELSTSELKYFLSASDRRRKELENAPLKTQYIRTKEAEQKKRKYPKTMVRVKFPDGAQLQAVFLTTEKGKIYFIVCLGQDLPSSILTFTM
jgi:hypothetical protein